jgi:hypothetical protein
LTFVSWGAATGKFPYNKGIHIWINSLDTENANLMILLGFIILGHPSWKQARIKIYNVCKSKDYEKTKKSMNELVQTGRLPISEKSIRLLVHDEDVPVKTIINQNSGNAGLTMIGIREELVKREKEKLFEGYE